MRLLLVCFVACLHRLYAAEEPTVETKLGKYKGLFVKTFGGRDVAAFKGIRYAKVPKRFQESEIVESHTDIYDATKDGDDCLQIPHAYNQYPQELSMKSKTVGSEDCLFLNIYTPKIKTAKPYPVMVFIHGGGYMIGTMASNIHGPELLLDKDVVLVTINYRLGPFGFLAYDEDVLPGNIGLKDQSLALHWIKENIDKFGGDTESITIFGESAGGASVHLQMLSSQNKGMFHKAISQSGSVDCPWAMTTLDKMKEATTKMAEYLNCPIETTSLLTCLQEKTPEEIINAAGTLKKMKVSMEMIFKPVLEKEGGFITERDLLTRSNIPWLSGVNSGEGLVLYAELIMAGDRNLSEFNAHHKLMLPGLFSYDTHPQAERITKLIKKQYLGDKEFSDKNIKQIINLFSDGLFIHSQLKSVKKHEGESYLYLFTHESERSFSVFTQIHKIGAGAQHGDEMLYMFPFKKLFPNLTLTDLDLKVSKLLVDLWTNFARTGNPTPNKSETQWYESEAGKLYVTLSSEGIQLSKNLYSTRMNFWDNLFTTLLKQKDEL